MEYEELQRLFDQAESQIIELNQTLSQLRDRMQDQKIIINQLELKNQHLKTELMTRDKVTLQGETETSPNQDSVLSGRQRLHKFYNDGIHICHPFFGKAIDADEGCIFCQDLLDHIEGGKP